MSEREKTNVDAANGENPICAALTRTVEAKRTGDADALNAALAELGRVAETLFRTRVARTLGEFSDDGGYLTLVEDASDALSELLWVGYRTAETFRGTTEEEAASWHRTSLDRGWLDKRRTFVRRAARWRDALRTIPKRLRGLLETEARNDD